MMVKSAALLALPLASAFVAPVPKMATRGRAMAMNFGYEDGGRPAGGVQFFPDSATSWDPIGITKDADAAYYWRVQNGEIKNGRVAMLACLDYLIKGAGVHLPFADNYDAYGLKALTNLPVFGFWLPFFFMCGALDIATDGNGGRPGFKGWKGQQSGDRVPGNVQPFTEAFNAPGDIEIRTKEINNGRLAMISIFGIWAGELLSGGQAPLDTLFSKLG